MTTTKTKIELEAWKRNECNEYNNKLMNGRTEWMKIEWLNELKVASQQRRRKTCWVSEWNECDNEWMNGMTRDL